MAATGPTSSCHCRTTCRNDLQSDRPETLVNLSSVRPTDIRLLLELIEHVFHPRKVVSMLSLGPEDEEDPNGWLFRPRSSGTTSSPLLLGSAWVKIRNMDHALPPSSSSSSSAEETQTPTRIGVVLRYKPESDRYVVLLSPPSPRQGDEQQQEAAVALRREGWILLLASESSTRTSCSSLSNGSVVDAGELLSPPPHQQLLPPPKQWRLAIKRENLERASLVETCRGLYLLASADEECLVTDGLRLQRQARIVVLLLHCLTLTASAIASFGAKASLRVIATALSIDAVLAASAALAIRYSAVYRGRKLLCETKEAILIWMIMVREMVTPLRRLPSVATMYVRDKAFQQLRTSRPRIHHLRRLLFGNRELYPTAGLRLSGIMPVLLLPATLAFLENVRQKLGLPVQLFYLLSTILVLGTVATAAESVLGTTFAELSTSAQEAVPPAGTARYRARLRSLASGGFCGTRRQWKRSVERLAGVALCYFTILSCCRGLRSVHTLHREGTAAKGITASWWSRATTSTVHGEDSCLSSSSGVLSNWWRSNEVCSELDDVTSFPRPETTHPQPSTTEVAWFASHKAVTAAGEDGAAPVSSSWWPPRRSSQHARDERASSSSWWSWLWKSWPRPSSWIPNWRSFFSFRSSSSSEQRRRGSPLSPPPLSLCHKSSWPPSSLPSVPLFGRFFCDPT